MQFNITLYLLMASANSLDPDQARPKVGPDLDPNYITVFLKELRILF